MADEALKLKKILVVDDEEEIVSHLTTILKRANYQAIGTTSGRQAVELAKKEKPDLIILDVVIPDMMGGEVRQALAQDNTTSGIPIIFLTGLNTKEDELLIKQKTGNYRLLAKPATKDDILDAVSKVLGAKR